MNPYVQLPSVPVLPGRAGFLVDRCRNKRVLHLGCVDTGLLRQRVDSGDHVHQKLAAVASEIWGIDVDVEGISFLRDLGYDHLFVEDVCQLSQNAALRGQTFDVIVASEIVEHLSNPGLFLDSVKDLLGPETELIITVPNAFRIENLIWLLRGIECVHPDHNYWFSYSTATSLIRKSGLEVAETLVYSFQPALVVPGKSGSKEKGGAGRDRVPRPTARGQRFAARALRYFRTLPRRVLVSWLYRKTAFWADGIILVVRRGDRAG